MESFLCSLEDDFLDFYDTMEYTDSLDSPCSNESDQENQYFQNTDRKRTGKIPGKKVQQRKAANMRERRRMKSINDAFDNLRQCIPATINADRRLSKVDTLRLAIRYIGYLAELVDSCSEYKNDSAFTKNNRTQEKIIVRCHFSEFLDENNDDTELMGHSLSWSDENEPSKTNENKFIAKVWIPECPTESDLINLNTFTTDCPEYS